MQLQMLQQSFFLVKQKSSVVYVPEMGNTNSALQPFVSHIPRASHELEVSQSDFFLLYRSLLTHPRLITLPLCLLNTTHTMSVPLHFCSTALSLQAFCAASTVLPLPRQAKQLSSDSTNQCKSRMKSLRKR